MKQIAKDWEKYFFKVSYAGSLLHMRFGVSTQIARKHVLFVYNVKVMQVADEIVKIYIDRQAVKSMAKKPL